MCSLAKSPVATPTVQWGCSLPQVGYSPYFHAEVHLVTFWGTQKCLQVLGILGTKIRQQWKEAWIIILGVTKLLKDSPWTLNNPIGPH